MPHDAPRRVRRDRHERGMRGPMLPHVAPAHMNSDQAFAQELREAVEDLDARFGAELENVTFGFEEIPQLRDLMRHQRFVPLGRAEQGNPSQVVVYQRPIEMRVNDNRQLGRIVRDVLAENVAQIFGVNPSDVDPGYHGPDLPRD